MTIKINLKNGKVIDFNNFSKDIQRSEVAIKDLSIFDKFNQDGDSKLTKKEVDIANNCLETSLQLANKLKIPGAFFGLFDTPDKHKNDNSISALISDINAENVHAVLGNFELTTNERNYTRKEKYYRRGYTRTAAATKLTLTQALINTNKLGEIKKKEYLNLIVDAVAEASIKNSNINIEERNKYIQDLKTHINNLEINENTNADLINVLIANLLPNHSTPKDYDYILSTEYK